MSSNENINENFHPDEEEAVYVISIASQLSGMHPQTLRQYDRLGLVSPGRASGRGRRYSLRDIASLRNIQRLVGEGVNLAGIARIIELESAVANMAVEVAKLRTEVDALMAANPPNAIAIRAPQEVVVFKKDK